MDAAVRILRDGRAVPGGPAALVLITDDADIKGGSAVLLQVRCMSAREKAFCLAAAARTSASAAVGAAPRAHRTSRAAAATPQPRPSTRRAFLAHPLPQHNTTLQQCTKSLAEAMAQGRSQPRALHLVAAERPPGELLSAAAGGDGSSGSGGPPHTTVTDLFSDPCGWLQPGAAADADAGGSPWPDDCLDRIAAAAEAAAAAQAAAAADDAAAGSNGDGSSTSGGGGLCVVIDSLSALLLRHPTARVLRLLERLQGCAAAGSILALVHRDLHSAQLLAALAATAHAQLELRPVTPLQRQLAAAAGRPAPAGALRLAAKRRAGGRLKAETQYYALSLPPRGGAGGGFGGVETYAPPAEALGAPDARALVQTALAAAGKAGEGAAAVSAAGAAGGGVEGAAAAADDLARRLGGGVSMRLGLTAEERAARDRVELPFERRGGGNSGGGVHIGGGSAVGGGVGGGGVAPRSGGTIHYVRDSEGEADSDEDPDDDLDL